MTMRIYNSKTLDDLTEILLTAENEDTPVKITIEDLTPWSLFSTFNYPVYQPGPKGHPFDIEYRKDSTIAFDKYIKVVFVISPSMSRYATFLPDGTGGFKHPAILCGNSVAKTMLFNPVRTDDQLSFYVKKLDIGSGEPALFNLGFQFRDPKSGHLSDIIYDPSVPNDGN